MVIAHYLDMEAFAKRLQRQSARFVRQPDPPPPPAAPTPPLTLDQKKLLTKYAFSFSSHLVKSTQPKSRSLAQRNHVSSLAGSDEVPLTMRNMHAGLKN